MADVTIEKEVQSDTRSTRVRLGVVPPNKFVELQDLSNEWSQPLLPPRVSKGSDIACDQGPPRSWLLRVPCRRLGSFIHRFQEREYVSEQLTDVPRSH